MSDVRKSKQGIKKIYGLCIWQLSWSGITKALSICLCFILPTRLEVFFFLFVCFLFFLASFRAAPVAYRGSQARGQIRAVVTGLRHSRSNAGSEPFLWPTPHLMATRSLTHRARPEIKPTSSWILVGFVNPWATMGTPRLEIFER